MDKKLIRNIYKVLKVIPSVLLLIFAFLWFGESDLLTRFLQSLSILELIIFFGILITLFILSFIEEESIMGAISELGGVVLGGIVLGIMYLIFIVISNMLAY